MQFTRKKMGIFYWKLLVYREGSSWRRPRFGPGFSYMDELPQELLPLISAKVGLVESYLWESMGNAMGIQSNWWTYPPEN